MSLLFSAKYAALFDLYVFVGQADFIVHYGLGGAMFWTLDFDDFDNSTCGQGTYPLIGEVRQSLDAVNPVSIPTVTGICLILLCKPFRQFS